MKTALVLTLARIFICPLFLFLYLSFGTLGISLVQLPFILLFLLILCELSDIFDGIMARRSNQVTELGKILDPMADSVVRISILLCFTQPMVDLPLLLVFVFILRDSVISMLRTICALRGKALAARFSGKLKAVFQAIAIFLIVILMIPYSHGIISLSTLQNTSFWIVVVTALYTVFSGIEYIWVTRSYIKQAWVTSSS